MITRRRVLASSMALLLAPACKSEPKPPASCTDTSGLKPEEAQVREALGYVDRSTEAEKKCSVCVQYVPTDKDGACGGCRLLKGPIHPLGSCKAFAKKG